MFQAKMGVVGKCKEQDRNTGTLYMVHVLNVCQSETYERSTMANDTISMYQVPFLFQLFLFPFFLIQAIPFFSLSR